jgi:hypothetical protein
MPKQRSTWATPSPTGRTKVQDLSGAPYPGCESSGIAVCASHNLLRILVHHRTDSTNSGPIKSCSPLTLMIRSHSPMRILQALLLSLVLMVGSAVGSTAPRHATKTKTVARTGDSSHSVKTVKAYIKKNGAPVQTYKRTAPNRTQKDNFSTQGNVNPYTGKKGTKTAEK